MKIINKKINLPLFLVLYISYLISENNASHLRSKLTFSSKMKSKSHLLPSTTDNCGTLCLECSENNLQSCITCQPGIFEYKNKCYNSCPENTYEDKEWQICSECDSSCPVCWGPTSEMCGTHKGTKTIAVLLENEIKQFLLKKKFENNGILKQNQHSEENNKNNNNDFNRINNSVNKANSNYHEEENENEKENKDNSAGSIDYNNAWLNKINLILKDVERENLFPKNHKNKIEFNNNRDEIDTSTISMEDVYGSNKIKAELPVGSFSRKDGIFIPIPSYPDENMDIVESHWVYVEGAWLGNKWMKAWVPELPSFIRLYGEKNKIYFENGGYWVFDNRKGIFIY